MIIDDLLRRGHCIGSSDLHLVVCTEGFKVGLKRHLNCIFIITSVMTRFNKTPSEDFGRFLIP